MLITCLLLSLALVTRCHATLKAHALFSDHVVLQTTDDMGAGAKISGSGVPDETVTLTIADARTTSSESQTFSTKVDQAGSWIMDVNHTSGGPYTMVLSGSTSAETITVKDVMFGDVYICSGQSNMVFAIGAGNPYREKSGAQSIENATAEIAAANHPDMRLWFVPSPPPPSPSPLLLQKTQPPALTNLTGGCNVSDMCYHTDSDWGCRNECFANDDSLVHEWVPISPVTVRPLSAVCYIAVRNIRDGATPGRPVGIVATYVGGTPVGCWTDDHNADEACNVTADPIKNVPCDPAKACCPGSYDMYVCGCAGRMPRASLPLLCAEFETIPACCLCSLYGVAPPIPFCCFCCFLYRALIRQ